MSKTRIEYIDNLMKRLDPSPYTQAFIQKLKDTNKAVDRSVLNVKDVEIYYDDIEKHRLINEMDSIDNIIEWFKKVPKEQQANLTTLFESSDFSFPATKKLVSSLAMLEKVKGVDYAGMMKVLFNKRVTISYPSLLDPLNLDKFKLIQKLIDTKISTANIIEIVTRLIIHKINLNDFSKFLDKSDANDPLLTFMMESNRIYNYPERINQIFKMTKSSGYRRSFQQLLSSLGERNQIDRFLSEIEVLNFNDSAYKRFEIIARCHAVSEKRGENTDHVDYADLSDKMLRLDMPLFSRLFEKYSIDIHSLQLYLSSGQLEEMTEEKLAEHFERVHFLGERTQEFAVSAIRQAEVVKDINDLMMDENHKMTETWSTRKQIIDTFLLVDQMGHDLPVYKKNPSREEIESAISNQKKPDSLIGVFALGDQIHSHYYQCQPAKNLTMEDIKSAINDICNHKPHPTSFENRLLILPLLREALYRSTGQFLDHKKMAALIRWMVKGENSVREDDDPAINAMKVGLFLLTDDYANMDKAVKSISQHGYDEIYGPFIHLLDPYDRLVPDKVASGRHEELPSDNQPEAVAMQAASVWEEAVKLSDCAPAILSAYHLINFGDRRGDNADQGEIQNKLSVIMQAMGDENAFQQANRDYIHYLSTASIPVDMDIRSLHQQFFSDYIKQQANISKAQNVAGFFGMRSHLNQVCSYPDFLQMVKGVCDVGGKGVKEKEMVKMLKTSIETLLSEYLNSWGVSPDRGRMVRGLLDNMKGKEGATVEGLIVLIHHLKTATAVRDHDENTSGGLRSLKKRNVFGSRLQTTLDSALNLIEAFTGQETRNGKEYNNYVNDMVKRLDDTVSNVDNNPIKLEPVTDLDNFEVKMQSVNNYTDANNAAVIRKSVEAAFHRKNQFQLFDRGKQEEESGEKLGASKRPYGRNNDMK